MTNGMRWVGCAVVGLLAASATARGDDPAEADLKKLEGTWTVPAGDGGEVTYTFKGKSLDIKAPSRSYKMTIKLDPAAVPDKSIDFQIDEAATTTCQRGRPRRGSISSTATTSSSSASARWASGRRSMRWKASSRSSPS